MDDDFDTFLAGMAADDHGLDDISVLSSDETTAGLSTDTSSSKTKIRRGIITIFPPNTDAVWLDPVTYFNNPEKKIDLWCGQFELAPTTDALHAHIYVEFSTEYRPRFSVVRNIFTKHFDSTVNIRRSQRASAKQRQCAINYVQDEFKRAPNSINYVWPGCTVPVGYCNDSKAKKKADVTDTETQRLWIESKPRWWSWDRIVHESEDSKKLLAVCSFGKKYHEGRQAEIPRRKIQDVVIMYGAGGTGKTTIAQAWGSCDSEDHQERYYRRNPDDKAFWGGGRTAYKGQRIIHLEEFCGQEQLSRIKEICDLGKSGPSVNIKGSGTDLNHEIVLFTSNNHPAGWYRHLWAREPKQFHPFWRRITSVLFFPAHREDGTLNIPDSENPGYYIDQTNEWLEMQGDYDKCVEHAMKHWALPEQEANVIGDTAFSTSFNVPSDFYDDGRSGKRQRT